MMHFVIDILRNSILITGLVVVMMMMIESLNIESRGLVFKGLQRTKIGQVVIGALLGSIPGCMGGFATVSLYTHRMFSFGALVAMMVASSGDEAFVMLAMIPEQALILFAILFVIAVLTGVVTDWAYARIHSRRCPRHDHSDCGAKTDCPDGYVVHEEHQACNHEHSSCNEEQGKTGSMRHFGWKRITMLVGLAVFIAALAGGQLEHDHSQHAHGQCQHEGTHSECTEHGHHHEDGHTINLLDERWMNVLFAGLSVIVLLVLIFASDHFVEEHLWDHIVRKHLPVIFAWTFGVLLVLGIGLQYVDIDRWISDNTVLMILLATLIGIIPESGPHLIFVTLFAAGVVPFPVLLASSISQDGHASIPLLAESRKSFLWAKAINCVVALAAGFGAMLIM
ncbi:MAG: hypothetical protein E7123_05955 [Bacteroidales bacterium]|nr:hypothetical protein [Bacteroidales bacterium]